MPNCIAKVLVSTALLYCTWRIVKCPCDALIACHKTDFLISYLSVPAIIVINNFLNENNISPTTLLKPL